MMTGMTLYDKLWQQHFVGERADGASLIYIDRHLVHEVTSPQAFAALRHAGRKPWRRSAAVAVQDHSIPTEVEERRAGMAGINDEIARIQVETLHHNCKEFEIVELPYNDVRQGIVHVVGPELGLSLPGMTVVCGDSHTSTNGALGALAFGIGTSDVEHVLATGCLAMSKMRNMLVRFHGQLPAGVSAKDMVLALIGHIGTSGATGYTLEFAGEAVRGLSMEGRMTMCNMSIEAGARAGLIAVDEVTLDYVRGRPAAPTGSDWERAEALWRELHSDAEAEFDKVVDFDVSNLAPQVTWGNMPDMVLPVDGVIPDAAAESNPDRRKNMQRALEYMGLKAGMHLTDVYLDRVFIGSCTNARIEDLRVAAAVLKGRRIARNIKQALVVPGSGLVKAAAESEGLDRVFIDAGLEWREAGCSMCLAMNNDKLLPDEHCASTSNRNFEGRQGHGGRTHLVSPATAAASAVAGHLADARKMEGH